MHRSIFVLAALLGSTAFASSAEIRIVAGGAAFDGGPEFRVTIGEEVIGTGTVGDPVPAEGAEFLFDVAPALLQSDDPIEIAFINDKYEASVGDRNLQIREVWIDGVKVDADRFELVRDGATVDRDDGMIFSPDTRAVVSPPAGGWDSEPAEAAADVAEAPSAGPADAATGCEPRSIAVDRFANGVLVLNDAQKQALAPALAAEGCGITVTGFSSTSGAAGANQAIATTRAQAVLDYLLAEGGSFVSQAVVGFGETDQFGPAQIDNRRVVVELK